MRNRAGWLKGTCVVSAKAISCKGCRFGLMSRNNTIQRGMTPRTKSRCAIAVSPSPFDAQEGRQSAEHFGIDLRQIHRIAWRMILYPRVRPRVRLRVRPRVPRVDGLCCGCQFKSNVIRVRAIGAAINRQIVGAAVGQNKIYVGLLPRKHLQAAGISSGPQENLPLPADVNAPAPRAGWGIDGGITCRLRTRLRRQQTSAICLRLQRNLHFIPRARLHHIVIALYEWQ
jgi:hypothetical protein